MISIHLFNALRTFSIFSIVFTALSALLVSIRLYRQQHQRAISKRLEWSTYGMCITSVVCVVVAMALSNVIMQSTHIPRTYGLTFSWYYGED